MESKDTAVKEAVFTKDTSVFKNFKEDTKPFLRKCFKKDLSYSKIGKLFGKDPDQLKSVEDFLFKHYPRLLGIFAFYAGTSSYPTISYNDITSFAQKTGIYDNQTVNLAACDLLMVATNVSNCKFKLSSENEFNRYELLEFLVRSAVFIYMEKGVATDTVDAINSLLEYQVYPNAMSMDGKLFRKNYCYNEKMNELITKNKVNLKKLYNSFTYIKTFPFHQEKKDFITLEDMKSFVKECELEVSEAMVGAIYTSSMMTIDDTMSDKGRNNMMCYVEFLVFLCQVSHEHFEQSDNAIEPLFIKFDHLMSTFLNKVEKKPKFTFGLKLGERGKHMNRGGLWKIDLVSDFE